MCKVSAKRKPLGKPTVIRFCVSMYCQDDLFSPSCVQCQWKIQEDPVPYELTFKPNG